MRRFLAQLGAVLLTLAAFAQSNFPPPTEFQNGYTLPGTTTPAPRAEWLAHLDVALLALCLGLAAYLVLVRRSRRGVLLLTAAALIYFGFVRHGCICPVGSIQNVAFALGHGGYALPLTVALFFVLPLLFTLFVGRVFCAAVCPLGAAQEVVLLRPLPVPRWLEHALGLLPFIYLGTAVLFAATGSAFLICQYDPFVLFFRQGGSALLLIVSVAMLLVSMVVGRPYCRFLCPYGALMRLLAPFSWRQTQITRGTCVNCHLCAEVCPYGAIHPPTPELTIPRREGKGRLALLLLLLPVLVGAGAFLVRQASPALARLHPTVRTAEQVYLHDNRLLDDDAAPRALAFAQAGTDSAALYAQAAAVRRQCDRGSLLLGAWLGLVIGLKLISLAVRRRRTEYAIDTGACVGCARCYAACPVNQPVAPGVGETVGVK